MASAQGVDKDSQRDHHTDHHLPPEWRNLKLVEPVAQHSKHQGADQGADALLTPPDSEAPPITTAAIPLSS